VKLNTIKKYIKYTTLVITITLVLSCGGTKEEINGPVNASILLDSAPNANHLGIYLALEKGYFSAENITLTINTPSNESEVINSVINGTNDFAIGHQLELLKAIDDGASLKGITAITQNSLHALVSSKDSIEIKSPKDIIGKTVGSPGTIYSEKLLKTMLTTEGSQLSEINLIPYLGKDIDQALINGEVDIIISPNWPRLKSRLNSLGKDSSIIEFTGWAVPEFYELVLITTTETTKDRENLTKRFVRALRKGYEDSINDPASGVQAMINQAQNIEFDTNLENENAKNLIDLWKPFRPVRGSRTPLYGDQDAEMYQVLIRWMRKHQLVGSTVNYADSYLNKFNLTE